MWRGLNPAEKLQFERDGYVILRGVIRKTDCHELMTMGIKPVLRKNRLYYTGKKHRLNRRGTFFSGKDGQPLSKKWRKWKPLFKNPRLNLSICDMHPRSSWKWVDGAVDGLGWIHMRYPYSRSKLWKVPSKGWHIDGLLTDKKINSEKSVTVMPLITSITNNGGGTAIFKGSHRLINDWILSGQNRCSLQDYIDKIMDKELVNNNNIVETTGEEGDILIMHPHLLHAPSMCSKKNKLRVTFNLSVNYSR